MAHVVRHTRGARRYALGIRAARVEAGAHGAFLFFVRTNLPWFFLIRLRSTRR